MFSMADKITHHFDGDLAYTLPTTIVMVSLTSVILGTVFLVMGLFRVTSIANYMPYPGKVVLTLVSAIRWRQQLSDMLTDYESIAISSYCGLSIRHWRRAHAQWHPHGVKQGVYGEILHAPTAASHLAGRAVCEPR